MLIGPQSWPCEATCTLYQLRAQHGNHGLRVSAPSWARGRRWGLSELRRTPKHELPWLTTGSASCHLWLLGRGRSLPARGWTPGLAGRTEPAPQDALGTRVLQPEAVSRYSLEAGCSPVPGTPARPPRLWLDWRDEGWRMTGCGGGPGPHTGGVEKPSGHLELQTPPPSIAPWGPLQGTSTPTPTCQLTAVGLKKHRQLHVTRKPPPVQTAQSAPRGALASTVFLGGGPGMGHLLSRHMGGPDI